MKKYTIKKGFVTIDLIAAIAVFSILSIAVINIIVSFEKNLILANKKQEMNFYVESIAKEVKYLMKDSERNILKSKNYINKENIRKNIIVKEKLINIVEDKIIDNNFYIEIKINDDKNLQIKYINNKMGAKYVDVEQIKIL